LQEDWQKSNFGALTEDTYFHATLVWHPSRLREAS
jgi:hypothetical protein